jgi:hypothetical protein
MKKSSSLHRSTWPGLVFAGLLALAGFRTATSAAQAPTPEPAARYPYDPVCPWGRIADGHGILVRCLEAAEVQRLALAPAAPQGAAAGVPAVPPLAATSRWATSGAAPPTPTPAPNAAAAPPAMSPAAMPPPVAAAAPLARSPRPPRKVSVKEVGPARADTGDLPEAQGQLRRPLDRYARCVETNGGLEAASGEVILRFLVRERGRAEGVAVKEHRGLSLAAAKCVADVIDRRYVGYPAAPIVGATLSIEFGDAGPLR